MRVLIQRVSKAAVRVDGHIVGQIEQGLVIFVGATHNDTNAQAKLLGDKVTSLRIFSDANDKMNLSLLDVGGGALVVSQFTLYANVRRGRRPDFVAAARPEHAAPLVEQFARRLEENGITNVQNGVFGASMQVEIHNDGPVTIWLDTAELSTEK